MRFLRLAAFLSIAAAQAWAARPDVVWKNEVYPPSLSVLRADPNGDLLTIGTQNSCAVVTKSAGSTGLAIWSVSRCSGGAADLAVDAQGDVLVIGSDASFSSVVATKYAGTDGHTLWERTLAGRNPFAVAFDGLGNGLVSGYGAKGVTAKLAGPDGALLWETEVSGPHSRVVGNAQGDAFIATVESGMGSLIKLAAADGSIAWRRDFPSQSAIWFPGALVADGDGIVVTGGTEVGEIYDRDLMTARFDADGNTAWSFVLDTPGDGIGRAIALAPGGGVVVVGVHAGRITLFRHAADGSVAWQRQVGPEDAYANDGQHFVGVAPDGHVSVASNDRRFSRPLHLSRHEPANGLEAWSWAPANSENDDLAGMVVLPDGGSVVARPFKGLVKYGAQAIPEPAPTYSLASHDFGGQSMGTRSASISMTIGNAGPGALLIDSITTNSGDFWGSHDCGIVAPGSHCTLSLWFRPAVRSIPIAGEQPVSGAVSINSDADASPYTLWLSGTAQRSLVTHYYRATLGRDPDAGGSAYWNGEAVRLAGQGVDVNEAWFAMSSYFYRSPEYVQKNRDDAAYLGDLYRTFFDRAADPAGLDFWLGQVQAGMPRELVLTAFMFSAEFGAFTRAIFGNVATRSEVNLVTDFFRGVLNRLPDEGGLDHWVGRLRTAQCTGAGAVYSAVDEMSRAFVHGAEYGGRGRTDGQFVADMYNAFLRRAGELDGVSYWVRELAEGRRDREALRAAFQASEEFGARVAAVANAGCLQ